MNVLTMLPRLYAERAAGTISEDELMTLLEVERVLRALRRDHRTAVWLCDVLGHDDTHAARALEVSARTVRDFRRHGKQQLRAAFSQ